MPVHGHPCWLCDDDDLVQSVISCLGRASVFLPLADHIGTDAEKDEDFDSCLSPLLCILGQGPL